jgi:hypothetical protein
MLFNCIALLNTSDAVSMQGMVNVQPLCCDGCSGDSCVAQPALHHAEADLGEEAPALQDLLEALLVQSPAPASDSAAACCKRSQ